MKVGISDKYLDALGGGEKYMLSLAESLSKEHDVTLFWDKPAILEDVVRRFALDMSKIIVRPDVFSSKVSTLDRLKETRGYDLVIHLSDGSIPLTLARKTILHIQHPLPWISSFSLSEKVKLLRIDSIIYNSQFTKKYADVLFHKKNMVLYPPAQMIGKGKQKEKMILTVGRYNHLEEGGDFKKLGVMIEFFKKLVDDTQTDWELVLVVTYKEADKKYIEELLTQTKGYRITFKTNVTNDELAMLYRDATIYWHAAGYQEDLKKNPNRAEHFGISVVEAMSAGAIPVVINAGGIPEIVTDSENGYLWTTESELFEKTEKVMNDPELQKKLSEEALSTSSRFSHDAFEKNVKKLLDL